MHTRPRQAYSSGDQPRRPPLQRGSRRVWSRATSKHIHGWATSRALRLGAVATAVAVLVAIAATSAFGSGGAPIVGKSGSFGHRSRQISAASAFVLPPATQCVKGRQLTVRVHKLPGVRFVSAVVKIDGKPAISVKRAHITASFTLHDLPTGSFVLSITAKAGDGRKVTETRTYHGCIVPPLHRLRLRPRHLHRLRHRLRLPRRPVPNRAATPAPT